MRLHQGRGKPDFRRGRRLGKNDRLVVWRKPPQRLPHWSKEDYRQLPATLSLRLVRFESFVNLAKWLKANGFQVVDIVLGDYLSMNDEITLYDLA